MPESNTTTDKFLGGRLSLLQPAKGFRAGIDTVLLAAAANPNAKNILELGAGAGIAACCVLSDLPSAEMDLAEQNPAMLELARKNLETSDFIDRARLLELDVTARGSMRTAAGLKRDHYDSIIANPPFFSLESAPPAPGASRASARHMLSSDLEKWIRTAAAAARPGGEVIFIHTVPSLANLLAGFKGRFGAITILPISPHANEPATRLLIRGIKGSKGPLDLRAPLILHPKKSNAFHNLPRAIFTGKKRLNW